MIRKNAKSKREFDFLFVLPFLYPDNVGYVNKHAAFLAGELSKLGYSTSVLILPEAAKMIARAKLDKSVISVRKFLLAFAYYSLFNSSIYYRFFRYVYSHVANNPFDFTMFLGTKIIYNDIPSLNDAKRIVFNTWEAAYFLSNKVSPDKCFYIVYHNHENDFPPLAKLINDTYNAGFNLIATTEPIRQKFSLNPMCKMFPAIDPKKLNQESDPERKIRNTILIQLSKDKIKGANYAIDAIQQLLDRNQNLLIYSFGNYDAPTKMNERWSHFNNISDGDLKQLYGKCEIYVSPAVEAGIPGSAVEAMINGCATITTDVSGARELVEPGVNGIIIPPGDSYAIVFSVENLLSHVEIIKLLGRNGKMIKYKFSIENMTKTFLGAVDFYEGEKE